MTDFSNRLRSGQGSLWGLSLAASLVINAAIFLAIAMAGTFSNASASDSQAMTSSPPERIATVELVMESTNAAPEPEPPTPKASTIPDRQEEVAVDSAIAPVLRPRFSRTTAEQESAVPPVSAVFIGERNTRAASDQEATSGEGISQSGTESNFGETDTLKGGSPPEDRSEPDPIASEVASQGREIDTGSSQVVPSPVRERPPPPAREPRPVAEPEGESATARKTSLRGSVTQADRSAVDVVDSPMGRYQGAILRAVEEEWLRNGERYQKFVTAGYMTVKLALSPEGKVRSLEVIEAVECTDPQKGYTMSSIRSAKLPPVPGELKKQLRNGTMPELSITFAFPSL